SGDSGGAAGSGSGSAAGAGGSARGSGAGSGLSSAEERALTKEMSKIERQMGKLDSREAELHREMAAVSEGAMDTEKLAALDRKLKDVSAEKDALEERWMELGEQLEG
ncbi:ABC transporter ATP-binding protein, partial [Dietzia sp. E1]|nr:ABC transporter ATP-binding protein [Dietzia sp. E1]